MVVCVEAHVKAHPRHTASAVASSLPVDTYVTEDVMVMSVRYACATTCWRFNFAEGYRRASSTSGPGCVLHGIPCLARRNVFAENCTQRSWQRRWKLNSCMLPRAPFRCHCWPRQCPCVLHAPRPGVYQQGRNNIIWCRERIRRLFLRCKSAGRSQQHFLDGRCYESSCVCSAGPVLPCLGHGIPFIERT